MRAVDEATKRRKLEAMAKRRYEYMIEFCSRGKEMRNSAFERSKRRKQ